MIDEARHLIEWTAGEIEPANTERSQRILLSIQAKDWSDKTLQYSGLI